MAVQIRQTPIGGNIRDFLSVVDHIYRDDPNFVRPLDMDMKTRLGFANPFFEHAEGVILTAYRNEVCVGRATAQIDREHLKRYKDDVGFFGFFDTIPDQEVANALLEAAAVWLKERGMRRIRGPVSLSVNEEWGCLIDGFDTPPMIMMPHHLPYQAELIAKAGFDKLKDVYAWRYDIGDVPVRARKAHDEIEALPNVRTRHADMKNLDAEIRTMLDIFNDAWSENFGFVPATEKEARKMAADLKLILNPELTYIAEVDGEPAAFALALPNLNESIRDFKGKLLSLNLPRLLWRLKVVGPSTARLMLLGLRKKYRANRKYAGLSAFLYVKMNDAGKRTGLKWGELSWTLEDNGPVNVAIKAMGGRVYKKYRLFERGL